MSKPPLSKARALRAAGLAVAMALAALSQPTSAASASGSDTVQGLYDTLLSTMKNGRTLGQSGRFVQLEPVVRRTFDIASMARLSVGRSWATMSEAQRQQVIESFGRYISAIYADRFDSYAGQKLQVTDEQPAAAGVMVRSQIVKANGEPVKVDYLMRKNGDAWLISDIYLDGAISEVATRRSEFAAILRNEGDRRPDRGVEPQGQHADRHHREGVLGRLPYPRPAEPPRGQQHRGRLQAIAPRQLADAKDDAVVLRARHPGVGAKEPIPDRQNAPP